MNIDIAAAAGTDEEAVVELWRSCALVVTYNDPCADFRFARAKQNSDILLGKAPDGRIVASVMVGHDGHRGWLYYVAVAPDCRGLGFGSSIVQAAEKWLTDNGIAKVQLMVRETNAQVAGFYARLGFETAPRIVMQKRLGNKALER